MVPTARQAGLPNADKYRVILAQAVRLHERHVAVNPQDPRREAAAIWANCDKRSQFVAAIVNEAAEFWNRIKVAGLYRSP